jgi:formylglycine-generating enzyme required for sulfatase activity
MGQNGNVWEWHESAFDGINNSSSESRAVRGGVWLFSEDNLRASNRLGVTRAASNGDLGFRVASVPEPTSTVLMISAGLLAIARRRRRAAL